MTKRYTMLMLYVVLWFMIDSCTSQEAPTIDNCPDDMSREVNLGEVEVEVTWREPTVTSDVGAFLIFRSHESGDEFAVGETFVRYIFSDIEGRSTECEFTITVEAVDDKIPNIRNCPDDFTASYQIGSDSATATWVEPTASDDSGYAYLHSKTNEPGSIFHLWTFMHSVTYTFSDAANNIALCTFFITFEPVDTEAPIVHDCPQVVEVEVEQRENGSFVRWDGPNVEDNSGSYDVILETDLQKGSFFPIGLTHVAVSFVDPAGHKSECTTDVIVSRVDRLQPLVHDCPGDIIWGISNEEERANVYWDEPTASDNSGQVVLSFRSHNPGQVFTLDGSSKEVKYIFQDSSRNEALCKFRVSVEIDEIPPQIVGCPGNMERTIPSNNNDVYIDWEDPIAEDNTYHVSLVHQSHHGGDLFYEGETEVTYIFQDSAGNENLCSFLITVHKDTMGVSNSATSQSGSEYLIVVAVVIAVSVVTILLNFAILVILCKFKSQQSHRTLLQQGAESHHYNVDLSNERSNSSKSDPHTKLDPKQPLPPVPNEDGSYMELSSSSRQPETAYYIAPKPVA